MLLSRVTDVVGDIYHDKPLGVLLIDTMLEIHERATKEASVTDGVMVGRVRRSH